MGIGLRRTGQKREQREKKQRCAPERPHAKSYRRRHFCFSIRGKTPKALALMAGLKHTKSFPTLPPGALRLRKVHWKAGGATSRKPAMQTRLLPWPQRAGRTRPTSAAKFHSKTIRWPALPTRLDCWSLRRKRSTPDVNLSAG